MKMVGCKIGPLKDGLLLTMAWYISVIISAFLFQNFIEIAWLCRLRAFSTGFPPPPARAAPAFARPCFIPYDCIIENKGITLGIEYLKTKGYMCK
jgi:hypothetical protein